MKTSLLILLPLILIISACQQTAPDSQTIATDSSEGMVMYGNGFSGYLARPEAEGHYPGVILIHEWWGLNQNIKDTADKLAQEGFVVLAVDLYDGKVAETQENARIYAAEARNNPQRSIDNMKAAAEFLRQDEQSSGKVASFGYCFGGGMSLQLALNDEMDATVIYYGNLETNTSKLSAIDWPILGVFGQNDTSILPATVREFESSLDELSIENEIYIYDDVGHAFANPSNLGHDPAKTEDAWQKTVDFLDRNLK